MTADSTSTIPVRIRSSDGSAVIPELLRNDGGAGVLDVDLSRPTLDDVFLGRAFEKYGVTADQLEAVKARCVEWAAGLLSQAGSEPVAGVSSEELRGLIERRQAGFPTPTTEATRRPPGPQARPAQHHHLDPDRGIEL